MCNAWTSVMLIALLSMTSGCGVQKATHSVGRHPQGSSLPTQGICCADGAEHSDSCDNRGDSRAHAVHCHAAADGGYAIVEGGDAHASDVARVVRCGATAPSNAKVSGRARGEGAIARLVPRVIRPCSWREPPEQKRTLRRQSDAPQSAGMQPRGPARNEHLHAAVIPSPAA